MSIRPEEITKEQDAEQRAKRLGQIRTDVHTLLEGEHAKMRALTTIELQKILSGTSTTTTTEARRQEAYQVFKERLSSSSREDVERLSKQGGLIGQAASAELRRRLDPEDQDIQSTEM